MARPLSEDDLVEAYRLQRAWDEAVVDNGLFKSTKPFDAQRLMNEANLGGPRRQCPGDGERGCMVSIPARRERCHFCEKTIRLRDEGF